MNGCSVGRSGVPTKPLQLVVYRMAELNAFKAKQVSVQRRCSTLKQVKTVSRVHREERKYPVQLCREKCLVDLRGQRSELVGDVRKVTVSRKNIPPNLKWSISKNTLTVGHCFELLQ